MPARRKKQAASTPVALDDAERCVDKTAHVFPESARGGRVYFSCRWDYLDHIRSRFAFRDGIVPPQTDPFA